jgi:hypothetical protein
MHRLHLLLVLLVLPCFAVSCGPQKEAGEPNGYQASFLRTERDFEHAGSDWTNQARRTENARELVQSITAFGLRVKRLASSLTRLSPPAELRLLHNQVTQALEDLERTLSNEAVSIHSATQARGQARAIRSGFERIGARARYADEAASKVLASFREGAFVQVADRMCRKGTPPASERPRTQTEALTQLRRELTDRQALDREFEQLVPPRSLRLDFKQYNSYTKELLGVIRKLILLEAGEPGNKSGLSVRYITILNRRAQVGKSLGFRICGRPRGSGP